MSFLEKYLPGWTFRTSFPDFEPGETIEVMVTSKTENRVKARIGNSVLRISDAPANAVDTRVLVEIEEWDTEDHIGEGTYIETVGESAF